MFLRSLAKFLFIVSIVSGCSSDDGGSSGRYLCCGDNPFSGSNIDNLDEDQERIITTKVITPNGDGIYETFNIQNIDLYPDNTVSISDLNDNVVFEKENYVNATLFFEDVHKFAFIGKHYQTGRELASGTYKYKIVIGDEGTFVESGYLCLIRGIRINHGLDLDRCDLPSIDPAL